MKEQTTKEEEIMQILWDLKKGFVKDVLQQIPGPKPSYNTVSTIIRILEKKNFVGHETFGPTHRYYPLISKDKYKKQYLGNIVEDYFGNSYQQMVSFFAKEKKLTLEDLEDIIKLIKQGK